MHVGRNSNMKTYPGICYGFRPKSYWTDSDPLSAILRNVTGENRRQMITDYWNAGRVHELDAALLRDEATSDTVTRLGQIHPSFMGGEYLPTYLLAEVEIARICLQSTTSDVISLRARPVPGGLAYRMVDEYEGQFTLPITTSTEPLTLAELVSQFERGHLQGSDYHSGLALCFNDANAEYTDPEDLRHFTRIKSSTYRQLETHFEHVFDDWLQERQAERDETPAPGQGGAS